MSRQNDIAGCLVMSAIFGAVVVVVSVTGFIRHKQTAPLVPHIDEYLIPPKASRSALVQLVSGMGNAGYVRDRMVVIDRNKRTFDDRFFRLPDNLRASEPGDVGTIIWVEWSEERVGTYTDGSGAFVHICKVTVIDRHVDAVVAQRDFRGSSPPSFIRRSSSRYGDRPDSEIIAFLTSLAQKVPATVADQTAINKELARLRDQFPDVPNKNQFVAVVIDYLADDGNSAELENWIRVATDAGIAIPAENSRVKEIAGRQLEAIRVEKERLVHEKMAHDRALAETLAKQREEERRTAIAKQVEEQRRVARLAEETQQLEQKKRREADEIERERKRLEAREMQLSREKAEAARWRDWWTKEAEQICEAEFVKNVGGIVTLRRRDGSRMTINIERLSDEDQRLIRTRK